MVLWSRVFIGAVVGSAGAAFKTVFCDSSPSGSATELLRRPVVNETNFPKGRIVTGVRWGVPWKDDWDLVAVEEGEKGAKSSAVRQMILIRHGQYEREGCNDDTLKKLSKLGEKQAELTGKYLYQAFEQKRLIKQLGDNVPPHEENFKGGFLCASEPKTIYMSNLTRAKQTAELMMNSFPSDMRGRAVVDPDLRERYPCVPEPPVNGTSTDGSDTVRVESVFRKYFYRPTTDESSVEVFVGHANVIRYLVCRALQLPPEAWLRFSLPHCSITSLCIWSDGRVTLRSLGSAGHLPVDMVTTRNIRC
uniref:Serine/threonine-protein phosphatase PGAM5, mitochondrial n=1 Tax=Trypanosoma congolense (strain IL3000) TaxID=1068625 RepID=G0V1T6_TRYCI|nr:unnamed protein product [Trypanosoma congolense IL3000]